MLSFPDAVSYTHLYAVQGKVARYRQAAGALHHAGALEGGRGRFGHVEKRIRLEVGVAGRFPGVDRAHVDGGCDGGFGDLGLVQVQSRRHLADAPVHVGDGEMADAELHRAVRRVAGPGGGLRQGQGSRERENTGRCV